MTRCHRPFAAASLGFYVIAEILLSVLALGHRHAPVEANGTTGHASVCSHSHDHGCSPDHRHLPDSAVDSSAGDSSSADGSSVPVEHDCSICRHLAQVAVVASFGVEDTSQEIVESIIEFTTADVVQPSYLLPRPRAPPATV